VHFSFDDNFFLSSELHLWRDQKQGFSFSIPGEKEIVKFDPIREERTHADHMPAQKHPYP